MRIFKYELSGPDVVLYVRRPARFLSVAMQDAHPVVWALVDGGAPEVAIHVLSINTGEHVPVGAEFIGTVSAESGVVWHIFWELA